MRGSRFRSIGAEADTRTAGVYEHTPQFISLL
jgi:hypothetical protein